MKTISAFAVLFSLSIGAFAQSIPGALPSLHPILKAPKPPIKLIHKPKAMTAHRLEFQVADQMFFVNSIGGNFLLNVLHTSPDGERAFTIQGEFLPGAGAEGNYTCQGSTTIEKGQSQQLATLGHHVLSLAVKDVQEKK
jgi:hypothetical protein